MIKTVMINIVGHVFGLFYKAFGRYQTSMVCKKLGAFGEKSMLVYPFVIQGNENVFIGKNVSIRQGAILTAINARIVIRDWVITATDLIISKY